MKTALIIHGAFGSPTENWIPWLKAELEKQGYNVRTPIFPTPDGQNLGSWNETVQEYLAELTEESVMIGHSIGAVFALSVLEHLDSTIKATALASGFLSDLGNETFDSINHTFYAKEFDWEKIIKSTGVISVLHGSNDPYVPVKQAEQLATKLGIEPILIENGGHLNAEAGFTKFPQLLELLES